MQEKNEENEGFEEKQWWNIIGDERKVLKPRDSRWFFDSAQWSSFRWKWMKQQKGRKILQSCCFVWPGWVSWPLLINWFCLTFLFVSVVWKNWIDTNWDLFFETERSSQKTNFSEDKLSTRDRSRVEPEEEQFVIHLFICSGNICLFAAPYRPPFLDTTSGNPLASTFRAKRALSVCGPSIASATARLERQNFFIKIYSLSLSSADDFSTKKRQWGKLKLVQENISKYLHR